MLFPTQPFLSSPDGVVFQRLCFGLDPLLMRSLCFAHPALCPQLYPLAPAPLAAARPIDLPTWLLSRSSKDPVVFENQVRGIAFQLFRIIDALHSKGITHRDLKLNCLFIDESSGMLILGNFSQASVLNSPHELLSDRCGSPAYVSPEIISNTCPYSGQAADVWACGVILYCLLTRGKFPFAGNSPQELFARIRSAPEMTSLPASCSSASLLARDLVSRLLTADATRRWLPVHALGHPWFVDLYAPLSPVITPESASACSSPAMQPESVSELTDSLGASASCSLAASFASMEAAFRAVSLSDSLSSSPGSSPTVSSSWTSNSSSFSCSPSHSEGTPELSYSPTFSSSFSSAASCSPHASTGPMMAPLKPGRPFMPRSTRSTMMLSAEDCSGSMDYDDQCVPE